jgi:hypothetical protein
MKPPKIALICSACPNRAGKIRQACAAGLTVEEGLCAACSTRILNDMMNGNDRGLASDLLNASRPGRCVEIWPEGIVRPQNDQTTTFTDPGSP